jgi:hypothetical protein
MAASRLYSEGVGWKANSWSASLTGIHIRFLLSREAPKKARVDLFQAVLHDADRRKSAFAILGQVEVRRMEYGRPLGEPRHPMIESGEPWPPLRLLFPQS